MITIEVPKKLLEELLKYRNQARPLTPQGRTDWNQIRSLQGSLTHLHIDPLRYEEEIRAEWTR